MSDLKTDHMAPAQGRRRSRPAAAAATSESSSFVSRLRPAGIVPRASSWPVVSLEILVGRECGSGKRLLLVVGGRSGDLLVIC